MAETSTDIASHRPARQAHEFVTALVQSGADEFLFSGAGAGRTRLDATIAAARGLSNEDYRQFVSQAVRSMANIRALADGDELLTEIIYRAFDAMDEIFDLRYSLDAGMRSDPSEPERLYEGAGLGVQTSYSSILCALSHLNLPKGAHLIDLGSGYGRVGLVAGLWRADLRFTGYEHVGHRVDVSNSSAARAGLESRVRFVRQDLADPAFEIPAADAYYMFDPFCETTYRRVLARLSELGRSKKIAVVAKAAARDWFRRLVSGDGWSEPESVDLDTLQIFRSSGKAG